MGTVPFRLEQANDQTTFRAVPAVTKAFWDGYDVVLNGKRVTFPYKGYVNPCAVGGARSVIWLIALSLIGMSVASGRYHRLVNEPQKCCPGGCAVYKSLWLMLGFCLFAYETAHATEPAASACANGECVVFVNDKPPAAEALCDGVAVTIRWTVGGNVFLTTCEDAGTVEQNTNFLSDAAGNHAIKLVYGRPVLKQFVRQHPGGPVPDKFAPRPYCTPPLLQKVATSAFILLDKRPASTENGYCFEPTYVHYDKGQVTIDTAKARIAVSNKDYYGEPPTAQQQSNLAALIHQYGPKSAGDSTPTNIDAESTWTVTVDRSWLYERPSVGSNRHGYLIHGDHVAVIEQENPDWVKIRYVHDGHAPIEAWLKRQDITR
ncbi:SH3 domain-containing protein [Trinickia diaoshuihuensis]|uniref:SH3 domain-containing protein n=1 Tax=Trinickia diaoshuihuensis TaxID=2292265 RepID=UPI0013C2CC6D|nr:SH3 domain-containing protein [Trinickia diaoshuihuensis]